MPARSPEISHASGMARFKFEAAREARRFAHVMRRWGYPGSFHEWMRKARRDWREFKYWYRRAHQ